MGVAVIPCAVVVIMGVGVRMPVFVLFGRLALVGMPVILSVPVAVGMAVGMAMFMVMSVIMAVPVIVPVIMGVVVVMMMAHVASLKQVCNFSNRPKRQPGPWYAL
ncbi:hypothetical protein Dalk_2407 [Desulfatibacillum aliphaticivorans]|uniref:Uncharacterized protein n=1 Tax=Desulfatibacillum aliphaticivorans TaxID=218208 RepID=B8FB14_DESAL|nr:hypothetical protein Dalk_2407 [Desulfatibacillum aliphaticivorans]